MPDFSFFLERPTWQTNPDFFARSVFRAWYIWSYTLLMCMAVGLGGLILVHYKDRLGALADSCVILSSVGMVIFWARVLYTHSKIKHLFATGQIGPVQPGSGLEQVLRAAVNLVHLGLSYTFFLTGLTLLALLHVLKYH
jgi:hypothetical protein